VQRNSEIESHVVCCRLRCVEPPARFVGRGERPAAGLVRRALNSEQAKHRVTDQRDDLAAMIEHRGRGHLEIAAQQMQEASPRAGPQAPSSAQITVPQRGGDFFPVARRIKPLSTAWPARLPR